MLRVGNVVRGNSGPLQSNQNTDLGFRGLGMANNGGCEGGFSQAKVLYNFKLVAVTRLENSSQTRNEDSLRR